MSLANWNKNNILKFSIDHTKIDKDLTDFPILLNLSTESGQNDYDCSDIFNGLEGPGYGIDDYTKLVIHSDTTDNSTNFIDDSFNEHSIIHYGNTKHSTTESKFGKTSIYFDGDGDYLQIQDDGDFTFGTEDFTIDFWFNIAAGSRYHVLYDTGNLASDGIGMYLSSDANPIMYIYGKNLSSTTTFIINNWYHVALVKEANIFYLFINGILEDSTSNTTNFGSYTVELGVRGSGTTPFLGYLDEIRISKGIARWTSNFTPPNEVYCRTKAENKKIAIVYPSVQEHYVTVISGTQLITYIHGEQEQLFCEIENWDQANKSAQLWVKVPRVLAEQPTDLFLYYDKEQEDNTNYIGDTSSAAAQNVWDDNFVAVYHMAQDPSIGGACILESTSNSKHGTPYGSMTSSNLVNGVLGKALDFDGSDDYIDCGNNPTLNNYTFEALIKHKSPTTAYGGILTNEGEGLIIEDTYNSASLVNNNTSLVGTSPINTQNYIYIVSTYDTNNNYLYEDGISVGTNLNDSGWGLTGLKINYGYEGKCGNLIGCEYRISQTVRSDIWIKTTNNTLRDNLTTIQKADIYNITGYVKELGQPVQRLVCLYDRTSGELIDKIMSLSTGYYTLKTTSSGLHNLVCYDAKAAPDFDDLLISKVTPSEIIK